MAPIIEPVSPQRFSTWVRRRTFSVLFLGSGTDVPRPMRVLLAPGDEFRGQLQAAWMSKDLVDDPSFWAEAFTTSLGPYRRGEEPPDGLYLFHKGFVIGHHPGTASFGDEITWDAIAEYMLERMRLKAQQDEDGDEPRWTWTAADARDDDEPMPRYAERGSRGAGRGEPSSARRTRWSSTPPRSEPRSERTRPRPPEPAPPPPPTDGPYQVLDVAQDASDNDVRKAFRKALKANHPDRVAGMSKAIQDLAKEQTRLVLAAWEEIKAERGLR